MDAQLVDLAAPSTLYAKPRFVRSLDDCYFYHTMDLPGFGTVEGAWDLRGGVREYLGGVRLAGKRVLEVGTASGYLCFHMEQAGAEVVAYDLNPGQAQYVNVVPYARADQSVHYRNFAENLPKLNNAFWLSHRLYGSSARLVHGHAYAIPEEIGPVDIATFGCILLHLRDPFQALASAARLVRETVIITEVCWEPPQPDGDRSLVRRLLHRYLKPSKPKPAMVFMPDFRTCFPEVGWWRLSPEILGEFLGVLGFESTSVTYHTQICYGSPQQLFTVVGRRTPDRIN
jgi:SAM-dependent methyltransferase